MTDQALDILKLVLLGLLYLFFARVLWAVWSEVRRTSTKSVAPVSVDDRDATTIIGPPSDATSAAPARAGRPGRAARHHRAQGAAGQGLPLGAEITIGRDPSSTIVIGDDTFVSQHHARIYELEGQAMVEDLGSTNGSFHNGNRLVGGPACSTPATVSSSATPCWRRSDGRLRWGASTDPGRIRPGNEDNLLVEARVFVVADGMGGHRAGEVASALAVDLLRSRLNVDEASLADVVAASPMPTTTSTAPPTPTRTNRAWGRRSPRSSSSGDRPTSAAASASG